MTDRRDLAPHERWRADVPHRPEPPTPDPAPVARPGSAPLEGHVPTTPADPDEARRAWVQALVDRSEH